MKILLIRHTEQDYPKNSDGKQMVATKDTPLLPAGELQAAELAREIRKSGTVPQVLFVSPYLRTRQTGRILQEELNIPNFRLIDDLRDVDPNDSEGHTLEEIYAIKSDVYAHPLGPNQETLQHLVDRQRSALAEILAVSSVDEFTTIGIVSHGDPLCAMYWAMRYDRYPTSYGEMRQNYYPKKGEAYEFSYDNGIVLDEKHVEVEQMASGIERFV